MKTVDMYTDGACSGNPGAGGWCAILLYKGKERVLSGYSRETTNNRMELFGVIQGLAGLKEPCKVTVYSDSAYIVNAVNNGWLHNWIKNGWKTADNKEVKNIDLWRDLVRLMATHEISFVKVKGHSNDAYNNLCDRYAREEIQRAVNTLRE